MRIAQISDLHITAEGPTYGVAYMADNLAKVVSHINGLKADLVLVTGDIANNAELAETERAALILAGLEAPFYLTPGNHDNRDILKKAFPFAAVPASELSHLSYVIEAGPLRLIALDSSDPDAPNGRICQARATWLNAQLSQSTKPTLIFMHHPPMKCAVEETDLPPLEGADILGEIVSRHPQIQRILCGHIHLMAQATWRGCHVCTAPSVGMRLNWTPHQLTASRFLTSPPAYLWHMHNEDGTLITHEFTLDDPDGPFDFVENH